MNEEHLEDLVLSITEKMPDMKVHTTDLKRPTSTFVRNYFTRVLEELNVDVENLQKPNLAQLPHLEHPDSFSHILPITNLFFALNIIFKTIFVDDFSFTDLTDPKPNHTQVLISAMDNFHTFADWKALTIQEHVKEHMDRKDKYEQLRAQREALQEQLNQRAARKVQRPLRMCEVNEKIKNLRQRFQQVEQENNLQDQENTIIEAEVQEEKRHEKKLQSECQKLEEEAKQLESAIVSSPTNLMEKLSSQKNKKAEHEMKLQAMVQTLQQKGHQKEMYRKHLELYVERDAMITKILSLHQHLRSLESKMEDKKKQKEASNNVKHDIEAKIEKLRAKLAHMLELKPNMEQEILKISRECQKVVMQADDQANKAKAVEQEVVSLEEEIIQLDALAKNKAREYDAHYSNMVAEQNSAIQEMEQQDAEFLQQLRALRLKKEKELQ
ncbi:kinetochore protein Nuf2-like [Periplaneta americana]|uniref:kinetochore protein Nuf2-like n=1 Tax=Periplaneta americana TaxID=6978 RepID=UPI0037E89752